MTLTLAPAPNEAVQSALIQIEAYRERHTIEPIVFAAADWPFCAHDGIRIIPRRGGWRHDPDEVRDLERATAGYGL